MKSLKRKLKSLKRKENEKYAKKRIGKQRKAKKKRTKKLGTIGLEKKESKWTTQPENESSMHM